MCQELLIYFIVKFLSKYKGNHYLHRVGKGIRVTDIKDPYLVSSEVRDWNYRKSDFRTHTFNCLAILSYFIS